MAKIRNPLFSFGATGSVNKLTFSRSPGKSLFAHMARSKPRAPSQPRTIGQADRNARFAEASKAWINLSSIDKTWWEHHGDSATKTGYRWFVAEYIDQRIIAPDLPKQPVPRITI